MKNTFNEERTFGIEIEFLNTIDREKLTELIKKKGVKCLNMHYTHAVTNEWKLITDSSCGLELVSPILKGRDGLNQLEKVCEALEEVGAKVNKNCGLHVHHDINNYNIKDMKNLFATYIKFENIIDSFMPVSRRDNNNMYIGSMLHRCRNENEILKELQKCKSVSDMEDTFSTRYLKLNFQSYTRYGTIEFRQHSGTTDFEKIKNWVILSQQMVDNAQVRGVNFKFNENWNKLTYFTDVMNMTKTKGASQEMIDTLKYYTNRIKELA